MKLENLMTAGVVTVHEDEMIGEAREPMESLDIHALRSFTRGARSEH
jgi:predicted transcriptional regulator